MRKRVTAKVVPLDLIVTDNNKNSTVHSGDCEETKKSESLQSFSDYKTSSDSELIEVHSLGSTANPISVDITSYAISEDLDSEMKNEKSLKTD